MTFEPRHENKSCSACRERVNERVKSVKVVKVKVFQNIPGFQLLSDIQTFFIIDVIYLIAHTGITHWFFRIGLTLKRNNIQRCAASNNQQQTQLGDRWDILFQLYEYFDTCRLVVVVGGRSLESQQRSCFNHAMSFVKLQLSIYVHLLCCNPIFLAVGW